MNLTGVLLLAAGAAVGASPSVTAKWSCADAGGEYTYLSGDVRVADEACEIHAARAYVFLDGTNELKKVVAFGGVAVTNGVRRAYGDTVSYFSDEGLVVVSADPGRVAEVREGTGDDQATVRGAKVRFWTQTGQAEVLEAEAKTPGQKGARGGFNRTLGN